jgi:hypothetical protein
VALNVIIPVWWWWWWCGGGGVVVWWWWCGGGGVVVVVWWWCGGGGVEVVVVAFLPIIIPHHPSCFVLFCVVGWIVAIIVVLVRTEIYTNIVNSNPNVASWFIEILVSNNLFLKYFGKINPTNKIRYLYSGCIY